MTTFGEQLKRPVCTLQSGLGDDVRDKTLKLLYKPSYTTKQGSASSRLFLSGLALPPLKLWRFFPNRVGTSIRHQIQALGLFICFYVFSGIHELSR